jgi:hypothetical protein
MLGAAVLAGESALLLGRYWEGTIGHDGLWARLGAVFIPMVLAGAVYFGATLALKVPESAEILGLIRQRLRGGNRAN